MLAAQLVDVGTGKCASFRGGGGGDGDGQRAAGAGVGPAGRAYGGGHVAVGLGDVEKSAAVFVVEESAGAESEQMEGVDGVGPPVPACSEEEGVRVGASVSARVAKGRVRSSKTLGRCLDCG